MKDKVRGIFYFREPVYGKTMARMSLDDTEKLIEFLETVTLMSFDKFKTNKTIDLVNIEGDLYVSHNFNGLSLKKIYPEHVKKLEQLVFNQGVYIKGLDLYSDCGLNNILRINISRANYNLLFWSDKDVIYNKAVIH